MTDHRLGSTSFSDRSARLADARLIQVAQPSRRLRRVALQCLPTSPFQRRVVRASADRLRTLPDERSGQPTLRRAVLHRETFSTCRVPGIGWRS